MQNFIAITFLQHEWEQSEISIEFELRQKNRSWNGPQKYIHCAIRAPCILVQVPYILLLITLHTCQVHYINPSEANFQGWDIPGKLSHYHEYWCPGSLCRQVINSHDIEGSSSSKFYFQQNTTMLQEQKTLCIQEMHMTLLHSAGGRSPVKPWGSSSWQSKGLRHIGPNFPWGSFLITCAISMLINDR